MSSDLESLTPEKGVRMYLESRSKKITNITRKNHQYRLYQFIDFCDAQKIDDLSNISADTLDQYFNNKKEKVNHYTLSNYLSTLRVALDYWASINAVEDGLRESVPMPDLNIGDEINE